MKAAASSNMYIQRFENQQKNILDIEKRVRWIGRVVLLYIAFNLGLVAGRCL